MSGTHTAIGGKPVYGLPLGILMLDAQFPRIPGDMGNAATWPFPVHYRVVRDASPERVVCHRAEGLFDAFVAAGRELVADGVQGITTNCGFLVLMQDALSHALSVPVLTSSLMQHAMIRATLPPDRCVGILTIAGSSLSTDHLSAAMIPADTPIATTEGRREFTRAILDNKRHLDVGAARADNVDAARALVAAHPQVGAILLECTNMCPYAADIARATGLPVYSIETALRWFHAALMPTRFAYPDDL